MAENKSRQEQNNAGPRRGPGGGSPMGAPVAKANDFRGTMAKLIEYLSHHRVALVAVLIFAIISTIFTIVGPKILGEATTIIFEGVIAQIQGTGVGIDFDAVRNIILLLVVLYMISAFFAYIQGYVMAGISMEVTYRMRKEIAEKINRLPLRYFDGTTHGEVLSRITNDVDIISQSLNQSLGQIVTSITTLIGILIMMLTISWIMTVATIVVVPLSLGIIFAVVKQSQKYFKEQQEYLGHINGHIEEQYSGHNVVQAFNGQEQSIEIFKGFNETLFDSAWKSQFLSGLMQPIMMFVGNIGYVIVSIIGGYLAIQGAITVGDIQAFIQYSRQFNQPIMQIANISNVLQQTAAAAERVFEFLAETEEIPNTTTPVEVTNAKGHVAFKDVEFGYDEDEIIIHNFSTEVQPGQKIAIVGPTGAGKTTIVKLLMRFYDVNSGAILVDGHEITDFTRHDLRSMFGMVLQDAWLYNNTIMENIRYGRLDATDEEVITAADAAYVDHFVRTLPDGYDTILSEDSSNISQGQRQLLTIARVILADPRILILDEATSSVDTRTEVLIQKAMDKLMQNRTSFVIAHRLSTIRNADSILVMRDGDIVEQGNHDNLLEQDGFYAELYNSQFEVKAEPI
ncbi:MAG: ABC transporter ATP-binding protein [Phototrophicaceae bacterium]